MRLSTATLIMLFGGLLAAAPASAGLRAIYVDLTKSRQLQIEISDDGDARIGEVGSQSYGLLLDGDFYVIDFEGGRPKIARIRDVATAIDQVLPPIFKGMFDAAGIKPSDRLKIAPGEAGNAGGREGKIYHVSGFNDATPEKVTDYLINGDADLKPVGAALEQFMNAAIVPAAPLIGSGAPELIEETRSIFALGTPIDIGGRFRLNQVGRTDISIARFKLPGTPMTVPQLAEAMRASMAAKQAQTPAAQPQPPAPAQ